MLSSKETVQKLIECAAINKSDTVLEIGTGKGDLTKKLCEVSGRVVSYELADYLAVEARKALSTFSNLAIISGDAFGSENICKFDICVTSLPYSESLRFIKWLSAISGSFNRCVAIVQSEFMEKISASPGQESYRAVSVLAQRSFNIERLFEIDRSQFLPSPRVSSTAIRLVPRMDMSQPFFNQNRIFILNNLFSYRGRLVSAVAKKFLISISDDVLNQRIEKLDPAQISELITEIEARDN